MLFPFMLIIGLLITMLTLLININDTLDSSCSSYSQLLCVIIIFMFGCIVDSVTSENPLLSPDQEIHIKL